MLPFGDSLSSTDSATAVAALFARVDGTTKSSDFPSAYMLAVSSVRFTNLPRLRSRGADGISRFSHLEFPYMHQVFDSAVFAFRRLNNVGTRDETVYGAQYWACMYPLPLRYPTCYHDQRTTQGQRVWRGLRCKTLSFSTPSRSIPAISQTRFTVFRIIENSKPGLTPNGTPNGRPNGRHALACGAKTR